MRRLWTRRIRSRREATRPDSPVRAVRLRKAMAWRIGAEHVLRQAGFVVEGEGYAIAYAVAAANAPAVSSEAAERFPRPNVEFEPPATLDFPHVGRITS